MAGRSSQASPTSQEADDGALARPPLAALPGAKPGTFLIEEVGVVTAAYAQQLAGVLRRPPAAAGAAYRAPAGTRGGLWTDLPGTQREVDAIAGLSPPGLVRLTGSAGGKPAFVRAAAGGRYVHVATHGFFADPKVGAVTARRGAAGLGTADGVPVVDALTGRNPKLYLLNCGSKYGSRMNLTAC